MTKKIFRSVFLVAMVVFLSCLALIMGVLYQYYTTQQENQLHSELMFAASGVENGGMDYLKHLSDQDCRLTLVSNTGEVLFDSRIPIDQMENHAQREEIKVALAYGTGKSIRYSSTLTLETINDAKRLADGSVLRVSINRYTMLALVLSMIQPILIILAIALILSGVLANYLAKRIVKPLEAIDLDQPSENETYDELAPLLRRLEQQHRQIRKQREELRERKNEFSTVIRNMNEGLVLLGKNETILSINPAAEAFFATNQDHSGKDFYSLERNQEIMNMIHNTEENGKGEMTISRHGREYQLRASRVENGESVTGAVILIFDITEKVFAEQNRREFTANVSHELKTPLQSIMGSAELIQNGLVKQEDMTQFIARIYREAVRLVTLINDIIRLSQLDEQAELTSEEVDLYTLVNEEITALTQTAEAKHITMTLQGASLKVKAPAQLLHEVVYNLCDNAIRYNTDGGTVIVSIKEEAQQAVLTVSDNGIGIPKEHQSRIFERFYRVDKSHSKQNGGTGLGLSIVKHAVQYMKGTIDVKSECGVGTEITVKFPLKM